MTEQETPIWSTMQSAVSEYGNTATVYLCVPYEQFQASAAV